MTGEVNLYEWRKRIDKYWFWDEGEVVLTKEKALECIIIGNTLDGDEICFHRESKDKIYILPRYEEQVFISGSDLPGAIEWLCSSRVLTEAFTERFFEPNA